MRRLRRRNLFKMNAPPQIKKKRSRRIWIIVVLILLVPAIPIGFFASIPLIAVYKADSGFKKAKKTIDPEELRQWALQEIESHSSTNGAISNSEIPAKVKNLYDYSPEACVVPKTEDHETCVMIMWGGGFFSWGFDIGPTNYVASTNFDYMPFIWRPGIYYRHEGHWGLL
jgi:hypothetical protein